MSWTPEFIDFTNPTETLGYAATKLNNNVVAIADWMARNGVTYVPFNQSTQSPTLILAPPDNSIINRIAVVVTTAADADTATITIGTINSPSFFMKSNDCVLTTPGNYIYEPFANTGTNADPIYLYITPSGQTFSGYVLIETKSYLSPNTYTALDYGTTGTRYRNWDDVIAYINSTYIQNLADVSYQGLWSASGGSYPTNPVKGQFWIIGVAGVISNVSYSVGDRIIYNGSSWDRYTVPIGAVTTVAGKTGDVVLAPADVGLSYITNTPKVSVSQIDTDATLTANLDTNLPSQKAVKAFVVNSVADAVFAGVTPTSEGQMLVGATSKTTPIDADIVGLSDSVDQNIVKKLSWANIKATLKAYFDTVYTLTNLGGVPTSRTIGTQNLSGNITPSHLRDIGDVGNNTHAQIDTALSRLANTTGTNTGDQVLPTLSSLGAVPTSRNISGHPLSADISLVPADVGLGNVTDDAQLKASQLDPDGTLNANLDSNIASQKATKTYVDTAIATRQSTLGFTPEDSANKGQANGYAGLGSDGLVPLTQLPTIESGMLQFQDLWDASTGSYPTATVRGNFWLVSVAGTTSGILYNKGDWIIYNGSGWDQLINGANVVFSVNGAAGEVVLTTANVSDTTDKRYVTDAERSVLANTSGINTGNETPTTIGSIINNAYGKTSPIDTDKLGLMDSAASNNLAQLPWANVKSSLKAYFDTLYSNLSTSGLKTISFTQATPSPATIFTPPDNAVIDRVVVCVDTPASAVGGSISIGISGTTDREFKTTDADLTTAGTYVYEPYTAVGTGAAAEILTITAGGQTFAGRLYVYYRVPI